MSDKKWTRRAALGLIGTGAGLFAAETAGFTQIEGVRDVDLGTKKDPSGLVGFVGPDDEMVSVRENSRAELFKLSTNLVEEVSDDEPMTIENVEFQDADAELEVHDFDLNGFELPAAVGDEPKPVSGFVELTGDDPATGTAVFKIDVEQNNISVILDREVMVEVDIDYDPGDQSNFRDSGDVGQAAQPEDPRGTIESPGNVAKKDDGNTATTISPGSEKTKVGWRLPLQTDSSDYKFKLVFGEDTQQGPLNNHKAYLVDKEGNPEDGLEPQLDDLSPGENTAEYDEEDIKDVQRYLIIEQTGSSGGNGQKLTIDFFQLRPKSS